MFQTYLLSSPSLWFDNHAIDPLEQAYAQQHRALPARVLLAIGSFETIKPTPRYFTRNDMLKDNQAFADRLRKRGYEGLQVETSIIEGEDHLTVYPTTLTRALLQVFPGSAPYDGG
jgi:predicted alpha/beta superfamily hydrolase